MNKEMEQTRYYKSGDYTLPVVAEVTKQLMPKQSELLHNPIHETVDVVFGIFTLQLSGKSNAELIQIAARWGTEHVMQSVEASKQLQDYVRTINTRTNAGGSTPKA